MNYKVGQKVTWWDPWINDYPEDEREQILNRVFEIKAVDNRNETVTLSLVDGDLEVEGYTDEIELI